MKLIRRNVWEEFLTGAKRKPFAPVFYILPAVIFITRRNQDL